MTQELLEQFQWNDFVHPLYSLDLVSSDFHLFQQLKHHLDGRYFKMRWLSSVAVGWYDAGLKNYHHSTKNILKIMEIMQTNLKWYDILKKLNDSVTYFWDNIEETDESSWSNEWQS